MTSQLCVVRGSLPFPRLLLCPSQPLHTVMLHTPLTTALSMLLETGVSALPVVDERRCLVDVYARSQITDLCKGNAYNRLQWEDVTVRAGVGHGVWRVGRGGEGHARCWGRIGEVLLRGWNGEVNSTGSCKEAQSLDNRSVTLEPYHTGAGVHRIARACPPPLSYRQSAHSHACPRARRWARAYCCPRTAPCRGARAHRARAPRAQPSAPLGPPPPPPADPCRTA